MMTSLAIIVQIVNVTLRLWTICLTVAPNKTHDLTKPPVHKGVAVRNKLVGTCYYEYRFQKNPSW